MRPGARTPEELEQLLEDALVVRDPAALSALFDDGAVLLRSGAPGEARGGRQIVRFAGELLARDLTYLAEPRRVVQARDTALVVAEHGVSVARRSPGGTWRYAISLLAFDAHTSQQERT
jgi:hypothetical protein